MQHHLVRHRDGRPGGAVVAPASHPDAQADGQADGHTGPDPDADNGESDPHSPTVSPTPYSHSHHGPTPTPTSSAPAVVGITPEQFGAKGDGVADDTAAVQSALNSVRAGGTVTLPAGKTYRHTAVLRMSVAGTTLNGSGTLLATNEAASAVYLAADNITVDGPTLKMGATTRRWVAFEQMKLRLGRFAGIVVRNVLDRRVRGGRRVRRRRLRLHACPVSPSRTPGRTRST